MGYPYPKFCICAFLGPIASPRGPDFETENPAMWVVVKIMVPFLGP